MHVVSKKSSVLELYCGVKRSRHEEIMRSIAQFEGITATTVSYNV